MEHVALRIVRGLPTVGPYPSNSQVKPQEAPLQVIDLLDPTGFSLKANGWIPKIPALKSGGVRLDNPLSTGSHILAAADGNVTESMTLNATDVDQLLRYSLFTNLSRFQQYALDFQITPSEFQPVYLAWQAIGAPGPQYALIINMEVSVNTEAFEQTNYQELTLNVEREPYWRGIPPGSSPRLWSAYADTGNIPAEDFNDYDLVDQEVYNFTSMPLNSTTPGNDDCRKAYIDIPAEDIPGDAPALVNIYFQGYYAPGPGITAGILTELTISRYSRPTEYTMPGNSPYVLKHTNTLQSNPGGGLGSNISPYSIALGTDAATAADTGARGRKATCISSDVKNRTDVSYATIQTAAKRMEWFIDPTVMAGTYAVFLRGGQRGGAFGNQSVYLTYGFGGDDSRTEPVNPELTDAAPSEFWGVTYMGTLTLPGGAPRVNVSLNLGITAQIPTSYSIQLWGARTTGTSTLYIQDLILMPVDEPNITLDYINFPGTFLGVGIYDNTGYLLHGQTGDTPGAGPELRGSEFTLRPGVKNRLYFFYNSYAYPGSVVARKSSIVSDPNTGSEVEVRIRVKMNIVPRWRGVRDV